MGDLQSLETLTQAIVEGSAACARVLFLVSAGTTRIKDLQDAPNLGFVSGNKEDVAALQVEKYADLRIAMETTTKMETRLAAAFMLNETIQRDAERVTAEEIRYMARELEDSFGGVYSVLSQDFQMFLVQQTVAQMEKTGKLKPLPKETVKVVIITGLEALGRSHDLTKLNAFMQEMEPVKEEMIRRINFNNYADRAASGTGVDIKGLFMTDDEYADMQAKETQQAVMTEAMKSGAGTQVAKGMMDRMPASGAMVPGADGAPPQQQ
jgi:hypothetical protein